MTTAIIVGGPIVAVFLITFAWQMARAGSREMPPMPQDQRLGAHLHAERERMFPGTSGPKLTGDYDCHPQPCDIEEGYNCVTHRCGAISPQTGAVCLRAAAHADPWHAGRLGCWQTGKHRRRQSQGHEVVVASITDVPARRQP